ncbi:Protein of unknown function [Raineyella antarctica]|uniref:DUF3499 domain-containing protein n=1 Tax=Raineyella antarctica TaxID=1577474 RepID=A0A1G6H465_9ACTN|nr:Protein of unknown function [Raineyella antarctica]
MATLTFAYSDQQVVLGPLSARADPVAYDLCQEHSQRLSAPRGWDVIRLPLSGEPDQRDSDDLMALADAVRRVGLAEDQPSEPGDYAERSGVREVAHKGHLTMLKDAANEAGSHRGKPRRS